MVCGLARRASSSLFKTQPERRPSSSSSQRSIDRFQTLSQYHTQRYTQHTHSKSSMATAFCSCFASFLGGGGGDGEGKDEATRPASASMEMARKRRGSSGSGDNSATPTQPRVKHDLDMKGSQVQVGTTVNGCYVVGGKGLAIASLALEQVWFLILGSWFFG